MFSKLFKPKWQHSDAAVRKAAIKSIGDQELLSKIVAEDDSDEVRQAAVSQLNDLDHLLDLNSNKTLKDATQNRIREVLQNRVHHIHYTPALGNYLLENAEPEIISQILDHSKDAKLRTLAIECSQNPKLLLKACVGSSDSDTRLLAAEKIQDEKTIRQALKDLGKRDKRVTRILRNNLENINARKNLAAEIDNLLDSINRLGQTSHWKHDQARFEKLEQQWLSQFESAANKQQLNQWLESTNRLSSRLNERKAEYETTQPVLESMQSLCEITAGFSSNLSKRTFLRKSEADDISATLNNFMEEWNALPEISLPASTGLKQKFLKNLQQSNDQIESLLRNGHASQRSELLINKAEQLNSQKVISENKVRKLLNDWKEQPLPKNKTLAENLQSDFSTLTGQLEDKLQNQQITREKGLHTIDQWLASLEQSLEKDQTKKASKLFQQIEQKLKDLPECPQDRKKAINQAMANYRPRIRELEGWRHWGTDLAREELIKEAQSLTSDKELTVNDRATKIKELRQRWKKLGKIDPRSGKNLWQQFDSACTEAYQPVKDQQKAEANRRDTNHQKRTSICEELESLANDTDWNSPQWREIDKQFNRLHSQWKNAGPVNRKDWNDINERFKQAVQNVDEHLDNERRVSHNRRIALIEKVEQMQNHEDLSEAIKVAGDAQKAWQPTVTGKRHEEQKLWKRFRGALDVIYARDKDRRTDDANAVKSLLQQKQAICDSLKKLTELDEREQQTALSQQHKLQSEWDELEEVRSREGKKVEQSYHQLIKQLDEQQSNQQLLQQKKLVVQQLKGECQEEGTASPDDILTLILELEIILEIESPESDSEARMQLQVERLADAMSSRNESNELDEVMALAKRVCQYRVGHSDIEGLEDRVGVICERLLS